MSARKLSPQRLQKAASPRFLAPQDGQGLCPDVLSGWGSLPFAGKSHPHAMQKS
jgi:hypothetical protein